MKAKLVNILNYMQENIYTTTILILQFSFLFFLLYYSINSYSFYSEQQKKIKDKLRDNNFYYIENNEDYNIKSPNDIVNFRNFYEFLNENYYVLNCTSNNVFMLSENLSYDLQNQSLTKMNFNNKEFSAFRGYCINQNFIDYFNLELSSGNFFANEDFYNDNTDNYIPVILGFSFSSYFNIGDEIEIKDFFDDDYYKKIKVIGFLEKDEYIINKPIMLTKMESLDYSILLPNKSLSSTAIDLDNSKIINKITTNIYKNITESYLILNNHSDIDNIKNEALNTNFFDITVASSDRDIDKFKYYYGGPLKNYSFITVFLIICTFIELKVIILDLIKRQSNKLTLLTINLYFLFGGFSSCIFLSIFKYFNFIDTLIFKNYLLTWFIFMVILNIYSIFLMKRHKSISDISFN